MTDQIVHNDVELAQFAMDMLDHDAKAAFEVVTAIQMKYQYRANTVDNLDALRDEILTKLAAIGILASVDPTPCMYGEPPIVDLLGNVGGVQEFDHEQKQYEVLKANERNEEYLGQKEPINSRKKS